MCSRRAALVEAPTAASRAPIRCCSARRSAADACSPLWTSWSSFASAPSRTSCSCTAASASRRSRRSAASSCASTAASGCARAPPTARRERRRLLLRELLQRVALLGRRRVLGLHLVEGRRASSWLRWRDRAPEHLAAVKEFSWSMASLCTAAGEVAATESGRPVLLSREVVRTAFAVALATDSLSARLGGWKGLHWLGRAPPHRATAAPRQTKIAPALRASGVRESQPQSLGPCMRRALNLAC